MPTPLGWSRILGRPLFWALDNLVLPAEIAAYVLCENTKGPATAYLMPFPAGTYPRWSELQDEPPQRQRR